MATKGFITPEIMDKTWRLHENNVPNELICEILGISYHSVKRIIEIMAAAREHNDVDSLFGEGTYLKQKEYAKRYWGVPEKEVPKEAPTEQPTKAPDNELSRDFRDFAVRVLFELNDLNKNLEKLLAELGVGE